MPVVSKIKGRETATSIENKLEQEVWDRLEQNLSTAGYNMDFPDEIMLVAFKEEQTLQVYAKDSTGLKFIKEYPFTAYSGELGPKLQEGDRQIPEGVYEVEYLNPNSSYYLSIKVNYPNAFDKSKTLFRDKAQMGGDIFIHGKAATIGCIPIGDESIEEVFLLTKKAQDNKIKVVISPRDFRVTERYPEIVGIDWEEELYSSIEAELKLLPSGLGDLVPIH